MSLQGTIDAAPVKERLLHLKEYLPGQDDAVYHFAKIIAERLYVDIVPMGFQVTAENVLSDLHRGACGLTSSASHHVVGAYPSRLCEVLRSYVPQIAKATCPPDFAQGVQRFYDSVIAKPMK